MSTPALDRDTLARLAREAGAHGYTNRFAKDEPAFAFSIERLERFVALVLAAAPQDVMRQALQALEHARDHIGPDEPKPTALYDVEAAISALSTALGCPEAAQTPPTTVEQHAAERKLLDVALAAAPVAPQPQTERNMLPVYSVTLKGRAQIKREIPRERQGWWADVAPGQTLDVRDATAADLVRCSLDAPRSQDPADYVCEAIHRGALVPREALAAIHAPRVGLYYDASEATADLAGAKATGG